MVHDLECFPNPKFKITSVFDVEYLRNINYASIITEALELDSQHCYRAILVVQRFLNFAKSVIANDCD